MRFMQSRCYFKLHKNEVDQLIKFMNGSTELAVENNQLLIINGKEVYYYVDVHDDIEQKYKKKPKFGSLKSFLALIN